MGLGQILGMNLIFDSFKVIKYTLYAFARGEILSTFTMPGICRFAVWVMRERVKDSEMS